MNDLYEALEMSLQEMEHGADLDTVLFRYPELADELRPILEASVNARGMAVPAPPAEVVRRNRARVLHHAAQMREARVTAPRRSGFAPLRRAVVTLAVIAMLLVSGTNLVSAASATLPGDNLYPVKRTWEDVLLLFTFDLQQREALEIEHETERLHELRDLFAAGRDAEVEFTGLVTQQNGNEWMVSGVPVVISAQTEVRDAPIIIGSAVRVKGETLGTGVVLAERIRLLPPDTRLPAVDIEDHDDGGGDDHSGPGSEDHGDRDDDHSGPGSGDDSPEHEDSSGPGSGSRDDSSQTDNSGSGSESDHSNGSDSGNDNGDDGVQEDHSGSSRDRDDDSNEDRPDDSGGGGDSGSDD